MFIFLVIMDGNHKLCRLRCISNFPTVKKKTYLPKVQTLRKSERIANKLSKKIKKKYKNKGNSTFKNKSKPKVKQACNADLVVKLDSGCDETPVLGSYFCKKHNSNIKPKVNYNGLFLFIILDNW
jgi:hypothetical protein